DDPAQQLHQHPVADQVAESVVHPLEVVDVEQRDDEALAAAGYPRPLGLDRLQDARPVEGAGQVVATREPLGDRHGPVERLVAQVCSACRRRAPYCPSRMTRASTDVIQRPLARRSAALPSGMASSSPRSPTTASTPTPSQSDTMPAWCRR